MTQPTIPGLHDAAPLGFRFLVQLVDCADLADAKRELRGMYGDRCVEVVAWKEGSMRAKQTSKKTTWTPSKTGWRCYVPEGWKI